MDDALRQKALGLLAQGVRPVVPDLDRETHPLSYEAAWTQIAPGGASMSSEDERKRRRERFQAMRLASVGLELALSVIVGFFLGYWLDQRFDTAPVLSLVFLLLGTVAGMRGLFRAARRAVREEERRSPDTADQHDKDTSGRGTG